MKLFLLLALTLIGCGKPEDGDDGHNGETITGPQGEPGVAGESGESVVGPQGDRGRSGEVGPSGDQGPTGATGPAGASCSAVQLDADTVLFVCPDGTTAMLKSKPTPNCRGKKD